MSKGYHAVVWINHAEAKIHRFDEDHELAMDLHSHTSLQRLHHTRTGWEAGGNAPDDTEFFGRISGALEHSEGTVITGPGNAKTALKAYLDHGRLNVGAHIVAVEAMDDLPPAEELLALGRRYFVSADPPLSAGKDLRAL